MLATLSLALISAADSFAAFVPSIAFDACGASHAVRTRCLASRGLKAGGRASSRTQACFHSLVTLGGSNLVVDGDDDADEDEDVSMEELLEVLSHTLYSQSFALLSMPLPSSSACSTGLQHANPSIPDTERAT